MHKNKKYTLLTTALQDHLIKELNLNLNLNEPINNKHLQPKNRISKDNKTSHQSKPDKKGIKQNNCLKTVIGLF